MKLIVVCALLAVTWFGRSEGYVCHPCTAERKSRCEPLSPDCERVRGTCGCCQRCALKENERCGSAYDARCETGLKCVPFPNIDTRRLRPWTSRGTCGRD